jgi:urease accessory protein
VSISRSNTGRKGELRLRFAERDGQTHLAESYFRTPLQVMRPIYDSAGCLCVYLLSPTGGVVQGDEYCIDLTVEPGAHALFTTQAATKVYRMPERGASQVVNIEVRENAVLEYLPDAVILFKDADLSQTINVTLRTGAVLVLQEIVMPGRLARGEILEFRRYANRLIVRDCDGLILYDNVDYAPVNGDLTRLGLFDDRPCWGSWYVLGDLARLGIDTEAFCQSHTLRWDEDAFGSLSALHRNGIGARMVSRSLAPIYEAFTELWQIIRTQHMGLPVSTIRK